VVFTNGVFDLLHAGHVSLLEQAAALGASLIVAINSDASVRRLGKGPGRPLVDEGDRATLVAALGCVDCVVLFDEEDPAMLIDALAPDVLVKGGDYRADAVVGADSVRRRGGRVEIIPLVPDRSTTTLLERLRASP
jgi:rfaE bifunctional protein nucleotidyltransferase chain/domain